MNNQGTLDTMRARILSCYFDANELQQAGQALEKSEQVEEQENKEEAKPEETVEKSETELALELLSTPFDIEKGRQAAHLGAQSKDGKRMKTSQGWKNIPHPSNGGDVSSKPAGSASFGSFKEMPIEKLKSLDKLAHDAKVKNSAGQTLSNDEQYALDHAADIHSALLKKSDEE